MFSVKTGIALIIAGVVTATSAFAALPKANTKAPQGGNFVINLGGEPTTLHPVTSTDIYSSNIHAYTLDTLLTRNPNTYEWEPRLAEKWEIAKDNKTYTFFLRKNAFFHDGKPVTAEDVIFSFNAIFEPKYNAAHKIPYYEGIAKVEKVDDHTVKFIAKDSYFKNFSVSAGLEILPKHVYSDVDKSKKMNKTVIGAGPYMFEKYDKGQKIVLKKFDKWYGWGQDQFKGSYNFASLVFKFVKEENIELEMIKKGDLDYIGMTAEAYVKKTEGGPWGTKVIKEKVENSSVKGYGFIGWNFRKDLFQDKNVRIALAHLMNRDEMNKKFRFGMSNLATGPIYVQSEYAPSIKPLTYDTKKAQDLLAKAGWTDADKKGVLSKTIAGKKTDFTFSLIYANKDSEKYWTMYKEDLKKAGINMELKYLEWNSFIKLIDEGNFEAAALGWGGGDIDWDPKQVWHSSGAVPGGSNFIAYKNPEVDKLIDQARQEVDKKKRIPLLKEVAEKIAADAPYVFLFNEKFSFYAHQSRIEKPSETFKYDIGTDYWWLKP